MTNITFLKEGSSYKGFTLKGHACFNVGGPDILCSAISTASQMTANGLEEVAKVQIRYEEGDGSLAVMVIGNTNEISDALIKSFDLAMQNLHGQYSDFITLSRVEWSE